MDRRLYRSINVVRFRQRIQQTLNCAAWGTFFAALVVLASPLLAALILFISVLVGFVRPHTSSSAARLIDRHYHFNDRILTMLTLLRHTDQTLMEQLQVADAIEHLTTVCPQAVLPIRLPKTFLIAIGIFVLNVLGTEIVPNLFCLVPNGTESVVKILPIEREVLREKIVTKAEELAQKHSDEQSLSELFEQLETLLDRFDVANMEAKESLATLSEMEAAFQSTLESLQLETMEESLRELAKTWELAEKTLPISKILAQGNYSQAAWELKKLNPEMLESLSKPERKAMADQMQSVADNADQRNQKMLQEAAQKLSDALKNGDGESGKSAVDALADEIEKHGIRHKIGKDLDNKKMMLGMMKTESGLGISGGKQINKSKTSSQTWGSGTAGPPRAGQETDLKGTRQQQMLTGMLGEQGDAVTETHNSQEITPARSLRQYQEQYQHYRKISEAVLDSEPIPPGQRHVIRRYFESIRPDSE